MNARTHSLPFNSEPQCGCESSVAGDDAACAQGQFTVLCYTSVGLNRGQSHSLYCIFLSVM